MNASRSHPTPSQYTRVSPNFIILCAVFAGSGGLIFSGWLPGSPLVFIFILSGWLVSLCLHEYGHALVAWLGGDYTVAGKGYLTLDFTRYVDPFVSLALPVLILIMGGFAFPGGAVYIQTNLLRSRNWQSGVSLAGPAANLLCLIVLLIPFWLGITFDTGTLAFWGAVAFLALLNVSSILFNLLPVPGLDGYGVIRPWLPYELKARITPYEPMAIMILFALFLIVPGVASTFFGWILGITSWFGIDMRWVIIGMREFYFWR